MAHKKLHELIKESKDRQAAKEAAHVERDDQGNIYNAPDSRSYSSDQLWGSDPKCVHHIIYPIGGGIRCEKCGGWFCY